MNALPVPEATGLPFASENPGVSHACGHDGHIAMLLGAAAILMRERRRLPGSVKLIFQHAEEKAPGGAIELVRAGVMKGVSAIVGLHVMNGPVGEISVATGPAAPTVSDCAWIGVTGVRRARLDARHGDRSRDDRLGDRHGASHEASRAR